MSNLNNSKPILHIAPNTFCVFKIGLFAYSSLLYHLESAVGVHE